METDYLSCKKYLFILFLFILSFLFIKVSFSQSVEEFILQSDWFFKKSDDVKWLPATVPGTVHTDLLANKIIDDPFFGDNEVKLQWIENEDWEYKTNFSLEERTYHKQNIELVFKGLDTYAKVYLNDSLILTADNMFRTWHVECKRYLKDGANSLYILFESPVKVTKDIEKKLPGGERVFTRKAAYHYGWDWGPRFVTCGVWRNIEIKAWDYFVINNVNIIQNEITDSVANLTTVIEINSTENADFLTHVINQNNPDENIYKEDKITYGINILKINFKIRNPKLWWCSGMGVPFTYKIYLESTDNHERWHDKEITIGLRTIELIREKDFEGKSFYFRLNGVPVFAKGSNIIPLDNFLPAVTKEKYEILVSNTAKSGMNMLRVWGGGVYEDDEFYKLCDKYGILVWQDFMFACAMYPGNENFLENVKQEATDNVKRLGNHPCIALWCGNNEIDEGWKNWGWQKEYKYSPKESEKIWNDYLKIFNTIIPGVITEFASNQPEGKFNYIPSSPEYGWGHSESMKEGDSHYWGVWWGMEPFEVFNRKVPRFMSEYGFQGFPDKKTIKEFTKPEDRYLYSDVMKIHQKHPTGFETIQKYLEREYNVPVDFDKYNYVSQLLQAYGIKTAVEAQRRAIPYCMGTLYWQLNDCWPVISWSGMDYYNRWKALQYFVSDIYKDILISPVEEIGDIKIYIVSDRQSDADGYLELKLMDFFGKILWKKEMDITIEKNFSRSYYEINKVNLISSYNPSYVVLSSKFTGKDNTVYKNYYYFSKPKYLNLPKPVFKLDIQKSDDGFLISFTPESLVKNLYLYSDDDLKFSKNYFDMVPGEAEVVSCESKLSKEEFIKKLKYFSLADINKLTR